MTEKEIRNEVEELIQALLDEIGYGAEREDVIECALTNIVYRYFDDRYTIEDVIEAAKYLEIPIDIEGIVLHKIERKKRKKQRAKARARKAKAKAKKGGK